MIRPLRASLIALLLCAATPAHPAVSNDAQIRKLADDFAVAWNKHDPTAMASFWSTDGDLINPAGRYAKGRTEIQKLFQDEHNNGPMKNSTYAMKSMSVRFLEPTLALADDDVQISGMMAPDGSTSTLNAHVYNVL